MHNAHSLLKSMNDERDIWTLLMFTANANMYTYLVHRNQ